MLANSKNSDYVQRRTALVITISRCNMLGKWRFMATTNVNADNFDIKDEILVMTVSTRAENLVN